MISTPTVLVLGAGASVHLQYPLGVTLVNNLCKQRNSDSLTGLPMGWTADEANRFLTRLSRSGYYSIDAYLETVPSQADIGKYLIAREMKKHEIIDRLFPPHDSGWYRYLFNSLIRNGSISGFKDSRLSIITFNYDRSLETYLHEALMARFEITQEDARSVVSQIPIIHVHGSLGQYPEVPYTPECEPPKLLEISRQIQIIHEVPDRKDTFCNPEFEQAHQVLLEAERIFFLGFGFHPDNMRRFRFFTPENTNGREIRATVSGMGAVEVATLTAQLEPLGIRGNALDVHQCNNFFTHVTAL